MPEFAVRAGQFQLDGQPVLLQAGEFHYFRTPPDQWRHRLELLQAAGFNTLATYIPWLWHEPAEGQFDLDGHSHPLRNLAGFLDLAAELGFWIIARPGPYIMAESINEGIPPWVFQRYPQAAYQSRDNAVQNIASYLHPDFLACAARWYQAVFAVLTPRQITRGGRIILVQLDNEMGMIQWVRNALDANPDTVTRFAAYLRGAYGGQLAGRYPAADLPGLLRENLLRPAGPLAGQVVEDYRRFYRAYLREYMVWLWAQARAAGLEVPPIANIHGFGNGGKTFPIGLSQLIEVMRLDGLVSATDVYPIHISEGTYHQLLLVNAMTQALQSPAQPLFSVEFQAGGNNDFGTGQTSLYDLHARLCLSTGMRAINHYLFCDGENDPGISPTKRHDWGHPVRQDGSLRHHYRRYQKLSQALAAYGPALVQAQPETATTIGFVLDYFMTEVNNEYTRPDTDVITHQRDVILFDLLARGLALTHRPFNAVALGQGRLDPGRTPLCWVMLDKRCDAGTQQELADYVQRGGRLILAGRMCVEDFERRPCTILKDALGIPALHSDPPFTPSTVRVFNYPDVPVSFVETYAGAGGEVFATRGAGDVVGLIKSVGQGQVLLFGAALAVNALDDLDIVHQMALRMGCRPRFQLSAWADVRLSRGEAGSFLYLNNYQDDPVETTIALEQAPLLGGQAVHLPARQGLILPLDWQVRPGVQVHYTTAEVTAVEETPAALTLTLSQAQFTAELSAAGYECDGAEVLPDVGEVRRLRVRGQTGRLVLRPSRPSR